jgi:hypothetical protein
MAHFSGAFKVLTADQIGPYTKNSYVTVGPVRPPTDPDDAATKAYVDASTGAMLNATAPIHYDLPTKTMSISDASVISSGAITTGSQTIAGDKTFTGTLSVITPSILDSSAKPANTGWVKNFTNGSNRESSNGWISGGGITFVPGGTTFNVSATVCRFTDYTDDLIPVAGAVVTLPASVNVVSVHTGYDVVGIYIDDAGTIIQDPGLSWNTAILHGNVIKLGRLVHFGGTIQGASNSKFPVADRYDLFSTDFICQLAPLLTSPSIIAQSTSLPLDLSISVNDTSVWAPSSNITTSRMNPSMINVSAFDRPLMYGIWRDTAGNMMTDAASAQLNVHDYNPSASGATLVEITAGYWVNIPILYNASADVYMFQYPTEQYASVDVALSMVGRFVRLGSRLQPYVVRGFVTVQKDSVDLSLAIFTPGEYFNYAVGPLGASNGSGGSSNARQSNTAWMDEGLGDDSQAVVTYMSKPFQEHDAAASVITTASASNPFLLMINAGHHMETALKLKPFVMTSSIILTAAQIEVPGGNIELDASFATTANALTSLSFVTLSGGTGMDLDLKTLGGAANAQLEFTQMLIMGEVSFSARTISDVIKFSVVDFEENVTMNGGEVIIVSCEVDSGKVLKFDSTDVQCSGDVTGITGHDLMITNNNSGIPCTVDVSGSNFDGALTLNGANVTLNIDRSSLPAVINPILNGAVLNVVNDIVTQDVVSALNNAVSPLTSVNVVVDQLTFNSGLSGKVSTVRTVNGHPLSADVIVSASELGAGTVPRAQLPLPWISADIPNNAANTSGSAASLSAISTLPDGTMAATKGSIAAPDNSTKVATTAYVDRLRGVADGVATLDGTGKIPIAQIDVGALGSLTYKGTWDIPANLFAYPAPLGLLNGWFYIASVGGTIISDGVTYNVGDWMVYNGSSWEKVPTVDIGGYLSTWAGSSSVITVGTITSGTWTGDKVGSAYGGAGGIVGPALLKGTAGVVSAAAVDVDYVDPATTSTMSGDKHFSGDLTTITQARTDDSTLVATTAYVQDAANVSQANVIFMSSVGDDLMDGSTLNDAVKTFSRAVAIAIAGVPSLSNKYCVRCLDTLVYDVGSLPGNNFIDLDASSSELTGEAHLGDYNIITCRRITTPAVAKGILVHFTGGTNTISSYFTARRVQAGQIYVDSNQGTRSVEVNYIDGLPLVSDPVITCNSGSTLYVKSSKIRGLITAIGTNAVIDLTAVGDLTEATFSVGVDPGCLIKYPSGNAGGATGILKSNGFGVITSAVPGTGNDYLTVNDTITLSSDVVGSGSTAISTTISAGAVTLAKHAHLVAHSLIGNPTALSATPSAVLMSASSNPSSVIVRDSDANAWDNHLTEGFTSITTTSGTTSLTKSSPAYVEFTGTLPQTVLLPDATTITVGFKFTIINNSTGTVSVQDRTTVLVGTQIAGLHVQYICSSASSVAGVWSLATSNQLHTLTGDISGSGRATISTTIGAGTVSLSKMANLAANSLIGNPTGSSAAPSAVLMSASSVASNVIIRDSDSNAWDNHLTEGFASMVTASGTTTLSKSSSAYVEFTGTLSQTVVLPDATTLTVGFMFTVINNSTGTLSIQDGATNIINLQISGVNGQYACTSIASVAGTWSLASSNQSHTLTGDVSGSGRATISTTIGAGTVSLSKMANLAANSIIANVTAAPATPAPLTITAAPNIVSSAVLRDANANILSNNIIKGYRSIPTAAGITALLISDQPITEFTGASTQTVRLPDATIGGMTTGFMVTIVNSSSSSLSITTSSNLAVLTMSSGNSTDFICNALSNDASSWTINAQSGGSITLSGAISGAGSVGSVIAVQPVMTLPAGNVILTSTSNPIQYYSTSIVTSFSVTLPSALSLTVGHSFTIINDGSGTVSINDATPSLILVLQRYQRAILACSDASSGAGVWEISTINRMPMLKYFSSSNFTVTIPTGTLTCAQLYGGPIRTNGNVTLTMPTAVNFFSQMTAILGYSPPTGFNFQAIFNSSSNTLTLSQGGAHSWQGGMTVISNRSAIMTIWIENNALQFYDVLMVSGV